MLYKPTTWSARAIIESLEISLRPNTINKEDCAKLSTAWLLAYESLKFNLTSKILGIKKKKTPKENRTYANGMSAGAARNWK